jgi:hypothetical protein
MLKWIFPILTFVLIISCDRRDKQQLIPRRDLIPLLADLHVADAISISSPIADQFGKMDSTLLYSRVMDKYGYTKEELFYTLEYYTGKPEKLMEIYDEIFALLSARSEEIKARYSQYTYTNTSLVWRSEMNRYDIQGDTAQYPVFDSIPIDSAGTFVLTLNIKLDKEDESENPVLIAYFYNPKDDTPDKRLYFDNIELHKSKYSRELMLIREVADKSLNCIRIIPVSFENKDSSFYKSMDLYNVRLSRVNTDIRKKSKKEILLP